MNEMNCAATPSEMSRILNSRTSIIGVSQRSSHQMNSATNVTSATIPTSTGGYSHPSLGAFVITIRNVTSAPVDSAAPSQSNDALPLPRREYIRPSSTISTATIANSDSSTPK